MRWSTVKSGGLTYEGVIRDHQGGVVTGSKGRPSAGALRAVTEDTVSVLREGLASANKNKMGVVTFDHPLVDTGV